MRKVIHFSTNATAPAPLLPPPPLLPSSNSSPSSNDIYRHAMSFFPPIPVLDYSAFDLATVALISGLLLLSFLSVSFIFHLRLKSQSSDHLRNFNSLWTVRFLLISFITLWALNEIIRLPIFRQQYLYPFLPFLTISQQANLCKTHVVLSLGFFEPGFLTLFVFFSPSEVEIPDAFRKSFVLSMDDFGNKTVLCTYPLLNTTMFGAFGIAYSLGLLLSCWRVVSLVINKALRIRIHLLALAVTIFLPLQILLMGLSALWRPEKPAYGGVMLAMCVCMTVCAVVGEGVLVIKPVVDALAAGGDCCRWSVSEQVRQEIDWQRTVDGMRQ
ncbi:hypothetical protein F0562_026775 [Nyssa sinensis]|uniref:G-protein coupled receptors family 3 profile domain-containing protein n=1 Tax=Nyssa sinensis TaxID=561372 RepID=A0A5J5BAB1_9ASTE|nr:hypothetical protein F0562_026775 [Nyssa sinensis]